MKIDGKLIAEKINQNLKRATQQLASQKIIPQLSVILIGNDQSSKVYVNQKLKTGNLIGIKVNLNSLQSNISVIHFKNLLKKQNQNKLIHAIIIQRPVPIKIADPALNLLVNPEKDVDGFHPKSKFDAPVALAVIKILKSIHPESFLNWLKSKKILIIGRGATAGKPIAEYFKKLNLIFEVANSKTENLEKIIKSSDIIISCVGKSNIVRHNIINKNSILIGVGLHPENEKLEPDYNQNLIQNSGAIFTPVPGGVGPVNVSMLMTNVIKAAKINSSKN